MVSEAGVNVWYCVLLVFGGIVFHFVTKLGELESQGKIYTPWAYLKLYPYTSLGVVLAAYMMMVLQLVINELSYSAALLTGIAANSMGDKLRARGGVLADQRINKTE